ncbi:TraR/DksA C4-type zinc finger protein [Streptomyces sp. NBC_01232]|uniref:TraR/DksA family transcriptional regulator n=1 Tax=Streptomyces sp. NBC_01232 TaxID=2903786 RepID=UPI002E109DF4|nr:TraR/DksA C4-type zinc finger protein [Streptomyces sp. NBC_01232]
MKQTIARQSTHLSPADIATLRENLHEQLVFRREQLCRLTAAHPAPDHQAEVHVALAAAAYMVFVDVRAALLRIADGRYGACHLCRRPIDRERLMIVPQARYCARCQQVREAGR